MDHLHTQLLRLVEENDVKFIRLVFCDLFGMQKNVAILADRLAHALEQGVSFDASAIPGFADAAASDLFLQPDPETFSLLPWRPSQSGVGRLYCHILHPDGTPFAGDGRRLLREAQRHAEALGLRALLGPECEFYLFETDDRGRPTRTPFDEAGYFDMAPLDRGENVRRQICLTLEEMGVRPERSHHEQGPGQNEIDFRCAPPLRAIDDLMSMQTVVTAVAAQNGLAACFAPKPLPECSGSGLHLNFSLMDGAQNLFEQFPARCDARAAAFLAGMLRRVPEICVFANPLPGSYGSQCMVLSVQAKRRDAKRPEAGWEAYCDNGREHSGRDVLAWVREAVSLGAGEILLTSVDSEGFRRGMDLELIAAVTALVDVPVIAAGGAGSAQDAVKAARCGADAVAVGSMLHYGTSDISQIKQALQAAGIGVRACGRP